MNKEQKKHSDWLVAFFSNLQSIKYAGGAKEHSGVLWKVQGLIDMAIEEVLDLANYLPTLRKQLFDFESYLKYLLKGVKGDEAKDVLKKAIRGFKIITGKPKG